MGRVLPIVVTLARYLPEGFPVKARFGPPAAARRIQSKQAAPVRYGVFGTGCGRAESRLGICQNAACRKPLPED